MNLKKGKKLSTILLCLVLAVSMLPIVGYAEEASGSTEGGSEVTYPIPIDDAHFPDAEFRDYISRNFDDDDDDKLSAEEIAAVKAIIVDQRRTLQTLKGIEYFTSLTKLQCSDCDLSGTLDFSTLKELEELYCGGNGYDLTGLNLSSNEKLKILSCGSNNLQSLDLHNNKLLTEINCSSNSYLDELNINGLTNLKKLDCSSTELNSLDVSTLSNLEELDCSSTDLNSLDVSKLTKLKTLRCDSCQYLDTLDVSGLTELTELSCSGSSYARGLTELIFNNENTKLETISCGGNSLTSLDVSLLTGLKTLNCTGEYGEELGLLSSLQFGENNKNLARLSCGNNSLTNLDVSKLTALQSLDCSVVDWREIGLKGNLSSLTLGELSKLSSLNCNNNQLTTLDVSKLTALNSLKCSNNQLTSLNVKNLLNLKTLKCEGNEYTIQVGNDRTFELSNMPEGFDASRVLEWKNGIVENNVLTVAEGKDKVEYIYNCSGEAQNPKFTATFTLLVKGGEHSVNVTSGEGGTASANPESAVEGIKVTLTAMPSNGYEFDKWVMEDGSTAVTLGSTTAEETTFTMPAGTVTVKAIFEKTAYDIILQNDGNGEATASVASATIGDEVTLTATAKTGYQFKEWEVISGGITITNNKFTMPAGTVTVKAIFEKTAYDIILQNDGNGTATASVASATIGDEVTLIATPAPGYQLKKWKVTPNTVEINENKFTMPAEPVTVTAIFEKVPYAITVTDDGKGEATASVASENVTTATIGDEVTLTATPNSGYDFDKWVVKSNNVTLTEEDQGKATIKFTMPAEAVEIQATFKKKPSGGGGSSSSSRTEVTTTGETNSKVTNSPTEVKNETKTDETGNNTTIATITVSSNNQREILRQAKANKSGEIIIKVPQNKVTDGAKLELNLEKSFIESILNDTDADLTIQTPEGERTFTQDELKEIVAKTTGNTVTVDPTSVTPSIDENDQNEDLIKGIGSTSIVLRSKLTKNKKVFLTWTKSKGYKVDYFEFYRSVKKNSGYGTTAFFLTKDGSWSKYLNTKSVKKGNTYYYKLRGVRIIDGKKYYTQWSNKAWRTVK